MEHDARLQLGIAHHRAGRYSEAKQIYCNILRSRPDDPDARHLLGVLTGQRGDLDPAIDLIRRAIATRPHFPEAHRNLATLLMVRGGFARAATEFQKAIETRPTDNPAHRALGGKFAANADFQAAISALSTSIAQKADFAEAHNDLGTLLSILNRLDDAIVAHSRAVTLNPDFAEAHYSLGNALSRRGRTEQALGAFRQAVHVDPDFADAHLNIGNLLRRGGRLTDAIAAYEQAIRSNPTHAVAFFNLGQALRSAGLFERSVAAYARAVQIDPTYIDAHLTMAVVLAELQRFDEARSAQARGAALMPGGAGSHDVLGQIVLLEGDANAASGHFRRAIDIDPNLDTAWNGLGVTLQSQGIFDEAEKCFRKKLELGGLAEIGRGYVNRAYAGRVSANSDELFTLLKVLDDPNSATDNRVAAGFALGKFLDSTDRFDEAFAAYSKGNLLWKQLRESLGDRYDPDVASLHVDGIIGRFDRQFFADQPASVEPSELPVFIVGMPRSGTTLVHQIAASHPLVHGAGERRDITSMAMRSDAAQLQHDAAAYLTRLAAMNPSAQRVIDKSPVNIQWLGDVALRFPGARVIFCRRNPLDTCLSCFFQWFTHGNIFSFDLVHCGHEYRRTERLREHWLSVLPLKMLQINYESLVTDFECQSRRLIDFLGLRWDPACLQFHQSRTAVLTASAWQVRQPIYQSSVGRWRTYERHLKPLIETFGR